MATKIHQQISPNPGPTELQLKCILIITFTIEEVSRNCSFVLEIKHRSYDHGNVVRIRKMYNWLIEMEMRNNRHLESRPVQSFDPYLVHLEWTDSTINVNSNLMLHC